MPIDSLKGDPQNVRVHDAKNLKAITASLREFGQQHPLVVDAEGVVHAGNGRLEAMRALGWSQVSIVRTSLPPAKLLELANEIERASDENDHDVEEMDTLDFVEQVADRGEVGGEGGERGHEGLSPGLTASRRRS